MPSKRAPNQPKLTLEICEKFFQLVREGKSDTEIASAIGYCKGRVLTFRVWLSYRGADGFIDSMLNGKFTKYTELEAVSIVEAAFKHHLGRDHIAALFNASPYQIVKLFRRRQKQGYPIAPVEPMPLPERIEHEFSKILRAKLQRRKTKKRQTTLDPNISYLLSIGFKTDDYPKIEEGMDLENSEVSYVLPKEKNTIQDTSREIVGIERNEKGYDKDGQYVGNSKLKAVRYRGQRKYGNKALPVAPTEDEIFALEEKKIKEIVQNTDLDDFDSVQVSINDLARIIHERAHRRGEKLQKEAEIEAEELINNAKRQMSHVERNRRGISAKEVNIEQWHKGGRRPIVKPYSEGFEELPIDIRYEILEKALKSQEHELALKNTLIATFEKKKKLATEGEVVTLSVKDRVKVAQAYYNAHSAVVSITEVCEWAEISRKQFYYELEKMEQELSELKSGVLKTDKYDRLNAAIQLLFEKSMGTAGARRITRLLPDHCGVAPGLQLVSKLKNNMGLHATRVNQKSKYKFFNGDSDNVAPNYIHRAVKADDVGVLVATDVTEVEVNIKGEEIRFFVSAFLDYGSDKVLGYSVGHRNNLALVTKNFSDIAEEHFQENHLKISHSDHGNQYMSPQYKELCEKYGITISMSNKGCSPDNGKFEQLWAELKRVCFNGRIYSSAEEVIIAIASFFERRNSDFGAPIPVVYGTDHPRPVVQKTDTIETYQAKCDVWKLEQKVYIMISKGHGDKNVRCPPRKNHLMSQVVHEIIEKGLDNDPAAAHNYAYERYNYLSDEYDYMLAHGQIL